MSIVGIIANPAAGKDIRRLVSYASISGSREKIDLVRRIILGIDATGVDEILVMPDYSGLGIQALLGVAKDKLKACVRLLDMKVSGTQADSISAMAQMAEMGAGCVVTIGGDGTSRAVAKGDRSVPLIAVSTGTNNVFPVMVEATTAGMAAGIVARRIINIAGVISVQKRLIIASDGLEKDMALVDAVTLDQAFIGAKAVWTMSEVREIFCTRALPESIGLSNIGGCLYPIKPEDDCGLYIHIGKGKIKVRAAVLPGVVQEIGIREYHRIPLGEVVPIKYKPCLMALDGERELTVDKDENLTVKIERDGPWVVDIKKTLRLAAEAGFFKK
jgi:predicted polyphosphate/ATP-dependent NAD kinase